MKKLFLILIVFAVISINQSCSERANMLKFNNSNLYYSEQVNKADAQKLGNYLQSEGFFGDEERSVKLDKNDKTWEFRLKVKKGTENDDQYLYLFGFFSAQLSKAVFNNDPVDIYLCNDKFETIRMIPFRNTNSDTLAN